MITKVKKQGGYWVVQFTQGVQTFTLRNYNASKKEAKWQKDRLDEAFANYAKDTILKEKRT
jgi:hypothetical protein